MNNTMNFLVWNDLRHGRLRRGFDLRPGDTADGVLVRRAVNLPDGTRRLHMEDGTVREFMVDSVYGCPGCVVK